MTLSENENKEIFDLTIGGLGLTGTIVNVTLDLKEIDNTQFITKKKIIKSVEYQIIDKISYHQHENKYNLILMNLLN